ncbi:MAG: GNAT family N-acetyltransferase, partial [Proteobacteria bacterium]|nr:GNAT family N-acetyltransferase [Pseudomonadota bacterium]
HMAIHPYPSHKVIRYKTRDGLTVTIRPIKPEDAQMEQEFVHGLSAESKYYRFMNTIRELSQAQLNRLTQIDYDREMAFIVTRPEAGQEIELAVGRYATNPDGESCEFAVVVGDVWQGRGLARRIMEGLIAVARDRGLKVMMGHIMGSNDKMLKLAVDLGFRLQPDPQDATLKVAILELHPR